MLRLIFLLAVGANLNSVISGVSASSESYAKTEASATSTSTSSKSYATAISSAGSSTYNDNNKNKCGDQCKENEVYSECPNKECRAKTCDELGFPLPCQQNNNSTDCGRPKCICKDGYVKNKNGVCVPSRDCPSCGGDPNAWSGSGTFCTKCTNYKDKVKVCPRIYMFNACDCRPNYVYDPYKKKCVLPEQCSQCKENEVYSECPNKECRAKTCDQLGFPLPFCQFNSNSTDCGRPGCICKEGFVKNKNGVCVPSRDCPSCGGDPNAWSGSGTFCTKCSNYKEKNIPCILIYLLNGCDCRPNYVYDESKKKCVLPGQCPPVCGLNEVVSDCANNPCIKKNCAQKDLPITCRRNSTVCQPGCLCAEGYLRANNGTCVPRNQCPTSCGPNEEYSSCVNGGCDKRNCSQVNEPALCIDLIEGACRSGCVCKNGYLRTSNGECVPTNQCPNKEVCPKAHEYYDLCPPSCPARKCGTDDRLVFCPKQPQPGDPNCNAPSCRCEAGYYRNSYGECVTFEECSITCGTNEIYYSCPKPTCSNQTCDDIGKIFNCPLIPANYTCKGECRCQPGYYRNKVNRCISEEQCKRCSGPHEYFDCDNACDNECDKLSTQSHANCPIVNIVCNEMCYCEEGYARNSSKICVPISQCPKKCGANEVYDKCPSSCPPRTCETKNRQYKCKAPLKPGDPNCPPPVCRCANNYYKNDKGKCVSKEDCPPECGTNEVISDCANSPCIKNCETKDSNYQCRPDPSSCKSGCVCAEGYLRNADGTCVSTDQCPPSKQDGSGNAVDDFNKGNTKFTINFFNTVVKANPGQSVIMSPYSLLLLLSELAIFTQGEARQQLLNVLNLSSNDQIRQAVSANLNFVDDQKNATFKIAAKNYVNDQYPLSEAFLKETKDTFRAEAENIDFSNAESAANIINAWVANVTNNKIVDLLPPSLITRGTILVMVNAIYFFAEWRYKFNARNTRPGEFYVSQNKNVTVDMMNQVGYFNYAELKDLDARAVELPYVNNNFSTIIILPNDRDGAANVVSKLADSNALGSISNDWVPTKIALTLPKFNSSTSIDLKDTLQKNGLTNIFDANSSGLTGITKDPQLKLFVSGGIQKATIIVNESGSEAAAANAIIFGVTSAAAPIPVIEFNVDHSYVYIIQFRRTPIFCGLYAGN